MSTSMPILPAQLPSVPRDFVFINDSHPDDSKSQRNRRLVRAHAAKGPHAHAVNVDTKAAKPPPPTKHQRLKQYKRGQGPPTVQLKVVGLEHTGVRGPPLRSKPPPPVPPKQAPVTVSVEEKSAESEEDRPNTQTQPLITPPTSATTPSNPPVATSSTNTVVASVNHSPNNTSNGQYVPRMPGSGWAAPFITHAECSEMSKAYIPLLVHNYLTCMAVTFPEIDAGTPFIIRRQWWPMMITSSCSFYITLLTSAAHYTLCNPGLRENPYIKSVLLELKQAALSSISAQVAADQANGGQISITTLGAIVKIASYEALFGSAPLYHTHMKGLQHMVTQRGGLTNLGMDGLVARVIMFIDINSAFVLGTKKMYFAHPEPLAGHTTNSEDNIYNGLNEGQIESERTEMVTTAAYNDMYECAADGWIAKAGGGHKGEGRWVACGWVPGVMDEFADGEGDGGGLAEFDICRAGARKR